MRGRFADYQDLLKRIQATFSRGGEPGPSESEVLAPVLEAGTQRVEVEREDDDEEADVAAGEGLGASTASATSNHN